MATKHFGYCAGSAMRRINAMRLMEAVPAVEAKIESGELSLSVASEVQSFFYSEAKLARPYSLNVKIELIETCLNKSRREVERELVRRNPEREKRESIRPISPDRVRVSFSITKELNHRLNRLKDLLSHSNSSQPNSREPNSCHLNSSTEDLLDRLAELGLDKFDPERKAERARRRRSAQTLASLKSAKAADSSLRTRSRKANEPPSAEGTQKRNFMEPETAQSQANEELLVASQQVFVQAMTPSPKSTALRSRYIPAQERHAMKDHARGCGFIDAQSGHRCG
jgi:hypothetical protein